MWELVFSDSDLIQLCVNYCEADEREAVKAINYAAQQLGCFKLQIKERLNPWANLPIVLFTIVKIVNSCSIGGSEIYISPDGYKSMYWNDYEK